MLAGNIIISQPKSKQGNIEVLKFFQGQSMDFQQICGLSPAWLSRCWPVSFYSIREKTEIRLSVRTTIIWLRWWNYLVVSQRISRLEAWNQESISIRLAVLRGFQDFKTGAWKMLWLLNTNSLRSKLHSSRISWVLCWIATPRKESLQAKC